jgi:hypothetical protein
MIQEISSNDRFTTINLDDFYIVIGVDKSIKVFKKKMFGKDLIFEKEMVN